MRSLAEVVGHERPRPRPHGRKYRHGVGFVLDPLLHSSKLDRNAKARLLVAVELLERKSKLKGKRNGAVSLVGLSVLRCLLLRFHGPSGLCCPSIETLKEATGFCRATIINSLRRLEAVGILATTRRLIRVRDELGRLVVRAGSNIYGFRELPAQVPLHISPKSGAIPIGYRIGTNYQEGLSEIVKLGGLPAFSLSAIQERRIKAGWSR